MGLNIGAFNNSSIIDTQALMRVTEKILNPQPQNSVDVSNLDLTKFNRVSFGTDLYAQRTNTDTALKMSKAASDFDVHFSKAFSANVQYLNSAAAQSLFTSKENTGKNIVNIENTQKIEKNENVIQSSNIEQLSNLNKDRRGSNPFSFYMKNNDKEENIDLEVTDYNNISSLNIFA